MISKYFKVQELVPEHIYLARGEKAWELIDDRVISTIDTLKERFPKGTMTINNWLWGGDREWSGLRTSDSPYYSWTSQHSFGRAIDAVFSAYEVEEVRQDIIDNPEVYPYIKGLELEVSWLHIDTRNCDKLKVFKA